MQDTAKARCVYLMQQNRHILLRKEDWEHIFKDIEENAESFARYYPMVRVQVSGDLCDMVRAFVMNDDLYAFCEKIIKED